MSDLKINYLGPASEADIGDRRMNCQWKLVPVEPTEIMVITGFESVPDECFTDEEVWEQYQEMSGCQQAAFRAKLCWAAMLASAPEPPPADAGEIARLTAERDALQQRLNAADQRADVLEGLLRLARGAIGENQWTLLTKDIDAMLSRDAQRTNNSGNAHCPHDGICHTSEETCAEALARIASLTAPAGAGQ